MRQTVVVVVLLVSLGVARSVSPLLPVPTPGPKYPSDNVVSNINMNFLRKMMKDTTQMLNNIKKSFQVNIPKIAAGVPQLPNMSKLQVPRVPNMSMPPMPNVANLVPGVPGIANMIPARPMPRVNSPSQPSTPHGQPFSYHPFMNDIRQFIGPVMRPFVQNPVTKTSIPKPRVSNAITNPRLVPLSRPVYLSRPKMITRPDVRTGPFKRPFWRNGQMNRRIGNNNGIHTQYNGRFNPYNRRAQNPESPYFTRPANSQMRMPKFGSMHHWIMANQLFNPEYEVAEI